LDLPARGLPHLLRGPRRALRVAHVRGARDARSRHGRASPRRGDRQAAGGVSRQLRGGGGPHRSGPRAARRVLHPRRRRRDRARSDGARTAGGARMSDRQRLAVIFGGRSVEHEVSVTSARGIMREADPERFDVIPFAITKRGAWLTPEESRMRLELVASGERRDIGDDEGAGFLAYPEVVAALRTADVVFPIVHGTFGEDGTMQGLLEMADLRS